jgi:hypothetical protein
VIYIPFLAGFFGVKALSLCDLSIAIAGGVVVLAVMEVWKGGGRESKQWKQKAKARLY